MAPDDLDIQLDWDVQKLHGNWPSGPDNRFMLNRLKQATVDATAENVRGRVLEVAASEAILSCRLSQHGLRCFALEPSPAMLERARRRMAEYDAEVTLVRGIAESLPFRDRSFDRVLCDSAIDHLADPNLGIREMVRLLEPNGRLVIGAVNYGSPNVRLSRLIYRMQRRLGLAALEDHLFWDSPVPIEHTFECTSELLQRLCGQYLELEHARGVSIGWMFPGWGRLLGRLPAGVAEQILCFLDRVARSHPGWADYILTVWRLPATPHVEPTPDPTFFQPRTIAYEIKIGQAENYWAQAKSNTAVDTALRAGERRTNLAYTGHPDRTWLDDLMARGPFRKAALLGCEEGLSEGSWLRNRASRHLDVYDLSDRAIERTKSSLKRQGAPRPLSWRARFIQADLNFAKLPTERYDVVWSAGCLSFIVNLEHLFSQVEAALRDGGLFAFHSYVGERRLQYNPQRLERINAVLREIPMRFRRGGVVTVKPPPPAELIPFCAIRSDEILLLAHERFEVVHEVVTAALFPLHLHLDLPALEGERPDLIEVLQRAENDAANDPDISGCAAYVVLRKRT